MKIFELTLVFVLVTFATSSVFSHSKNEGEEQSYVRIEIQGYNSANISFTYRNIYGNNFFNLFTK